MKRHKTTCELRYSRIISLPIIGTVVYSMECWLVVALQVPVVWASAKYSSQRDMLFTVMSRTYKTIYCQSSRFGRLLHSIKTTLVLDVADGDEANHLRINSLYDVMWSLVFVDFVSERTKRTLGRLLPEDYPLWTHE